MKMLTTPEENGRQILLIYAYFDSRPGHVLSATNFVAVGSRRRIPIADIQDSLDHAVGQGWLEETENGSLRLTNRGFEAMPQVDPAH